MSSSHGAAAAAVYDARVSATADVARDIFVSGGCAAGGARLRVALRGSSDEQTARPPEMHLAMDETVRSNGIVVSMDNEPDDLAPVPNLPGPARPRRRTLPR